MKKLLLSLILISSLVFAGSVNTSFESNTDPSVFRTNTLSGTAGQGQYVNTVVPRVGYLTFVGESKPATADMVAGQIVLYATTTDGSIQLSWIASSAVTGSITSGNITGF